MSCSIVSWSCSCAASSIETYVWHFSTFGHSVTYMPCAKSALGGCCCCCCAVLLSLIIAVEWTCLGRVDEWMDGARGMRDVLLLLALDRACAELCAS